MKNLAIARAGDYSLHETWLSDPAKKNFDLLVAYYGAEPGKWKAKADLYDQTPGLKYPWFEQAWSLGKQFSDYDAIWLADEDIGADTETVSDMFDIFHESGLAIGQPAMADDGVVGFEMMRRVPGLLLRHTEFVEEQVPIFSRAALSRIGHTFGEAKSGWGLGVAWSKIISPIEKTLGVIDACPVFHSRPLKAGSMYTHVLPGMGISARDELDQLRAGYQHDIRLVEISRTALDPGHPKTAGRLARQTRKSPWPMTS
jgi:hypothetical protein